ncbi:phage tail assembly chaperone [Klebsiella pasteurii]|uniref:phage tail assembly chaperone n=1 Tax=Klebsiella pasteurii TaxID=2587529 RepID=UPI003982EAB9
MECTINGVNYRANKLGVFDQLKVSRKLLPILAGLMSDFSSIKALLPASAQLDSGSLDKLEPVFNTLLPRIADEVSKLSEEDTNAIIHPCLAVVVRQNGKTWAPVFRSGELMFDDIDLFSMLQLVARVVADSLGNFLPELPTSETPPQTAP